MDILLMVVILVVVFVIGYIRGRGVYVCRDCEKMRRARHV